MWYCGPKGEIWVEYKVGKNELSVLQERWIIDQWLMRQNAYVVAFKKEHLTIGRGDLMKDSRNVIHRGDAATDAQWRKDAPKIVANFIMKKCGVKK